MSDVEQLVELIENQAMRHKGSWRHAPALRYPHQYKDLVRDLEVIQGLAARATEELNKLRQ